MAAAEHALRLRGDARVRRRRIVNRLMESLGTGAALVAVAILGIVVVSVVRRGAGELSWGFLTGSLPSFAEPGVGLATAIALPVGVLTALFLTEFAPRNLARAIQLAIDLMNGLPSIVIAIFVYGLLVTGRGQSGYAGAFALSIVMFPLIARSTQEVLRLVPRSLREGALALGASRWRTVLGIVLPNALGGIVTGTVLALARAAGETAPLLFATSIYANTVQTDPRHALPNIPVQIFIWAESPDPEDHKRAWAAAVVLLGFVLLTSLAARALLARSRRRHGR
jgi:phosphate transport system permease protein